jgi:hypothetical protein
MTSSSRKGDFIFPREFNLFVRAYSNTKLTVAETPAADVIWTTMPGRRSALALQQFSEPFGHREVTAPLICFLSVETSTIIIFF